MGILIDADELLNRINLNYNNHQNITDNAMKDIINTTPTAYNVDDVVAEAYNKGLNDAWELAKKIADTLTISERAKIFGYVVNGITVMDILRDFTPQEALAKLEAYEKEQAEIKVGDVVTIIGKPVVVTRVSEDKTKVDGFGIGGFAMTYKYDDCKKTGKHIDIQSVLQQIGGVE